MCTCSRRSLEALWGLLPRNCGWHAPHSGRVARSLMHCTADLKCLPHVQSLPYISQPCRCVWKWGPPQKYDVFYRKVMIDRWIWGYPWVAYFQTNPWRFVSSVGFKAPPSWSQLSLWQGRGGSGTPGMSDVLSTGRSAWSRLPGYWVITTSRGPPSQWKTCEFTTHQLSSRMSQSHRSSY